MHTVFRYKIEATKYPLSSDNQDILKGIVHGGHHTPGMTTYTKEATYTASANRQGVTRDVSDWPIKKECLAGANSVAMWKYVENGLVHQLEEVVKTFVEQTLYPPMKRFTSVVRFDVVINMRRPEESQSFRNWKRIASPKFGEKEIPMRDNSIQRRAATVAYSTEREAWDRRHVQGGQTICSTVE